MRNPPHIRRWCWFVLLAAALAGVVWFIGGCTVLSIDRETKKADGSSSRTRGSMTSLNGQTAGELLAEATQNPLVQMAATGLGALVTGGGAGGVLMAALARRARKREDQAWEESRSTFSPPPGAVVVGSGGGSGGGP